LILTVTGKIIYENNIRKFISSKNGLLDNNWKYLNYETKIGVTCEKGHRFESLWCHLKRGHWCPECAGQVVHEEDVRRFIEDKGGILEDGWKYINKTTRFWISCDKGHKWRTQWNDIKYNGSWCPYCSKCRVNVEDIKNFIKDKGGKLDDGWKYDKSWTKFMVTCEKGHRWETSWNVIQSRHWCPHCQNFKSEQEFRELIEKCFNDYFPNKKPLWLRYPATDRPLQLDGYCERKEIAFEYQGKQHYKLCHVNRYLKENLEAIQERDAFKKRVCEKRGVKLIVIPYWISKKTWEIEIYNQLHKIQIEMGGLKCQTMELSTAT
jgi:phage-related protein